MCTRLRLSQNPVATKQVEPNLYGGGKLNRVGGHSHSGHGIILHEHEPIANYDTEKNYPLNYIKTIRFLPAAHQVFHAQVC